MHSTATLALSIDEQAMLHQALASPVRLRILAILDESPGTVHVDALVDLLAEREYPLEQPTVSHHLRFLLQVKLISKRKDGLYTYYRVRHEMLAALREAMSR